MNMEKAGYDAVNLAVIVLAAALFIYEFQDMDTVFSGMDLCQAAVLSGTVFIVHFIKAGRLYLALYESGPDLCTYLKIYCKVTPVSVVFPYKAGELFRIYGYGTKLKSLIRGIVIVVLDRFMDTMALLTIILLVRIFNGGHISAFTYVLFLFLIFVLLIYLLYPGVYTFWKKYILKTKATEHKLAVLKILELFHNVYQEMAHVSSGRGMILYVMSLAAWTAEIGSLVLIGDAAADGTVSEMIAVYLESAMGNARSAELRQFVFVSVMMMTVVYAGIKLSERMTGKKGLR